MSVTYSHMHKIELFFYLIFSIKDICARSLIVMFNYIVKATIRLVPVFSGQVYITICAYDMNSKLLQNYYFMNTNVTTM